MKHTFATCLSCIDGRVQIPTIHWIQENYHVDYVDMITEVGIDGVLSADSCEIDDIIKRTKCSIKFHNTSLIFVVGHYDCAGNPVDKETHKKQIGLAVTQLQQLDMPCKIIGLWVSDKWQVETLGI